MASQIQERTISHTGSELGDASVERTTNAPGRKSQILRFTVPDKYESVDYDGERDATRFVPRTMQSATFNDDDGSTVLEEGERTIALANKIQPVAGEPEMEEQPYPAVIAVNTTQGAEIAIEDMTVDYNANEVLFADSAVAIDDTVKVYPILAEGYIQFQGVNQFGQVEGPVQKWDTPIYRWHDFLQDRAGTEVNLTGHIKWSHSEWMEVLLDSPHDLVWEDADFPGSYVSTFAQDCMIELPR